MSYRIKNLRCSYPASPLPVLHIEELIIEPNEVVFFVGPSGVGKSTLLETLALMNNTICTSNTENTEFDYFFSENQEDKLDFMSIWEEPEAILSKIRNDFYSFIFQQNNLFTSLSGFQNAIASSIIQGTPSNIAKSNAESVFNEILNDLNINTGDFEITKMSGGQRQRLAFIRAIITKYTILFADEPTGNLDWLNARILMDFLMKELKKNKSSAIIVSHDIDLAVEYADKIVYIEKKKTIIKKEQTLEQLDDEDFFFGRISNETIFKKVKEKWSCNLSNYDNKSLKKLIQKRFIEAQYLEINEEEKWKKRILEKK